MPSAIEALKSRRQRTLALSGPPIEITSLSIAAGRVVITEDVDFLRLHAEGMPHAGIVYCHDQSRSIGEMLRRLVLIHAALSPEEMKNRVEYV